MEVSGVTTSEPLGNLAESSQATNAGAPPSRDSLPRVPKGFFIWLSERGRVLCVKRTRRPSRQSEETPYELSAEPPYPATSVRAAPATSLPSNVPTPSIAQIQRMGHVHALETSCADKVKYFIIRRRIGPNSRARPTSSFHRNGSHSVGLCREA